MRPTAAAPAASEPEMQAKKPQPSVVELPRPVLSPPTLASATSSNLPESPERTRASPVRMNSGTAISAKALMPSNSDSPNTDSGKVSVKVSIPRVPRPMATHTGTPTRIITISAASGA